MSVAKRPLPRALTVLVAVLCAMALLLWVAGGAAKSDPAPSTTLSLGASPDTVSTGSNTDLSGELSHKAGGGIEGKRVILEQRPRGASAAEFERVQGQPAAGVLTGNGGRFELSTVKPRENTDYRARYEQGSQTSTSPIAAVDVRVNVGLDRVRKNVKVGKNVVMLGKVSPDQTLGTVKLVIKRNKQTFTRTLPLAGSSFTKVFVPNVAGRYTVFATYVPASGQTDFLGNSSKTRRFTAR